MFGTSVMAPKPTCYPSGGNPWLTDISLSLAACFWGIGEDSTLFVCIENSLQGLIVALSGVE